MIYVIHRNGKPYESKRNAKGSYITKRGANTALSMILHYEGHEHIDEFEIVEYVPVYRAQRYKPATYS